MIYVIGGILICIALLGVCCGSLWKQARHERHWFLGLIAASMFLVGWLAGIGFLFSVWFYYAVAVVGGYLSFFILDLTSGYFWQSKTKPERTITLKDGSKAIVDSKDGKGFQRL